MSKLLNPGQLKCPSLTWKSKFVRKSKFEGKKNRRKIGVHSLKRKRNSRHFSRGWLEREAPPLRRRAGSGREPPPGGQGCSAGWVQLAAGAEIHRTWFMKISDLIRNKIFHFSSFSKFPTVPSLGFGG